METLVPKTLKPVLAWHEKQTRGAVGEGISSTWLTEQGDKIRCIVTDGHAAIAVDYTPLSAGDFPATPVKGDKNTTVGIPTEKLLPRMEGKPSCTPARNTVLVATGKETTMLVTSDGHDQNTTTCARVEANRPDVEAVLPSKRRKPVISILFNPDLLAGVLQTIGKLQGKYIKRVTLDIFDATSAIEIHAEGLEGETITAVVMPLAR